MDQHGRANGERTEQTGQVRQQTELAESAEQAAHTEQARNAEPAEQEVQDREAEQVEQGMQDREAEQVEQEVQDHEAGQAARGQAHQPADPIREQQLGRYAARAAQLREGSGGKLEKLQDSEIASKLATVDGWLHQPGDQAMLICEYRFATFLNAIAFVNEAAAYAEAVQHHPGIHIDYKKVTLKLRTHDAAGITRLDFQSAHDLNEIYSSFSR